MHAEKIVLNKHRQHYFYHRVDSFPNAGSTWAPRHGYRPVNHAKSLIQGETYCHPVIQKKST